jgi:histone acetyltransferase (RNA polymerase elongator complex component)
MTKENCKHGLMEGTCAYCTGKITKATSNDMGSNAMLRIVDNNCKNRRTYSAALKTSHFMNNPM